MLFLPIEAVRRRADRAATSHNLSILTDTTVEDVNGTAPYQGTATELVKHLVLAGGAESSELSSCILTMSYFPKCFLKGDLLGFGAEGMVHRFVLKGEVKRKGGGMKGGAFAVKQVPKHVGMTPKYGGSMPFSEAPRQLQMVARRRILSCGTTRGICQHYCFVETDSCCYTVMEDVRGQTLSRSLIVQLAKDTGNQPEMVVRGLFRQLMEGLNSLHRKDLIHRDIKPDNIMVCTQDKGNHHLKIIDLSSACPAEVAGHLNAVGTPAYIAPELADPLKFRVSSQADMYSAGITLGEMLSGISPVPENPHNTTMVTEGAAWEAVSSSAIALVRDLTSEDPLSRPTCREVLKNPWMKDTRKRKRQICKRLGWLARQSPSSHRSW
eukprot:GHVU01078517.1.p1 GENE.GHVU01078517.1~~GHVU01078517.1.p1  ORF type:complete len:381 (+),score=32.93 GHVU01078517.1:115-1257(+)